MRGEHQLTGEAKLVHGHTAIIAIKRSQGLNLFHLADERTTHRPHCVAVIVAVTVPLLNNHGNLFIGYQRGGLTHQRNVVANIRVGVRAQKIGQLHDVAVGVIIGAASGGVRHDMTFGCEWYSPHHEPMLMPVKRTKAHRVAGVNLATGSG